jgi:hypothetical protein
VGLLFNVQKLTEMDKTQERQAATKPAWGAVAVIGAMVAVTMGDSITMAAIGTALLIAGAWLGGYMTGDARLTDARHETGTPAGERSAA